MTGVPPRSTVTVRIGGEEHVLRSTAEPEYVRRCAALLDERIREVRTRSGVVETHRAVLLAALSITDECLRAQGEGEGLRGEVVSRTANLARRIEDALSGS